MKVMPEQAIQHIVERPKHLDQLNSSERKNKLIRMAQTLKVIERTKALCYDEIEFGREFSVNKHYPTYLIKRLVQLGIKKPRVAREDGKIYIWSNDEK